MSSQADKKQTLDAKIAWLETELEVEREQSEKAGSRIKELEQNVKKLEIEKRLSTPKPNDQSARSEVSRGAPDPKQQAQISQLREELITKDAELATRDAELATKDATIEQLFEAVSFLRSSLIGYRTNRNQAKEGMRSVKQCWEDIMDSCDTDDNDILLVHEQTSQFEKPILTPWQDNPTTSLPEDIGESSSRAAKPKREGASEPPQPSRESTTAELPANAASGPPRLPPPAPKPTADRTSEPPRLPPPAPKPTAGRTSEPPQQAPSAHTAGKPTADTDPASTTDKALDYAQALKTKREKLPFGRAKVPLEQSPLFATSIVTHADLAAKKEVARRTHSETQKPQISQKPNRALTRGGSIRGRNARGNEVRGGRGNRRAEKDPGSEPTQTTVPDSPKKRVGFERTNATGGEKRPSGEPNIATPTPVVRKRRKTTKWSTEKIAIWEAVGHEIPSETDTEGEAETKAPSVAVAATSGSPAKVVEPSSESLHGTTVPQRDVSLSVSAHTSPKAQPRYVQPAIPVGAGSAGQLSGGKGDNRTAIEEPKAEGSKLPRTIPDPKSDIESNTTVGQGEAGPPLGSTKSPAARSNNEVNPPISGSLPQAGTVKDSSDHSSAKGSQGAVVQVSQATASNQTPSNAASSTMAPPSPAPSGSQLPLAGERPDRRTKFAKGYKPFESDELEDVSDDELVKQAVKDVEDDDTDSDHVLVPQKSKAIPFERMDDFRWDEEPMPVPPQSKPAVPEASNPLAWQNFQSREAAEQKRRASEMKMRGGPDKGTTRHDQIYHEKWRQTVVDENNQRREIGVKRGTTSFSSGGVPIGEGGKEGSGSNKAKE